MFLQLAGALVGFGAAAVTKKISKKRGSVVHKILSPAMAVVGAAASAAVTGEAETAQAALTIGLNGGMMAVFGHSVWSGSRANLPRRK